MAQDRDHPAGVAVDDHRSAVRFFPQEVPKEISLTDLWIVLVQRKRVVGAVVAVAILAGLTYALLGPLTYAYVTTIAIGTRVWEEKVVPIEAPGTVLAKIVDSYIPLVLQDYEETHTDDDKRQYKIRAKIPEGSDVVILNSVGKEKDRDVYIALQNAVADMMVADHNSVFDVLQKGLETNIGRVERHLAQLQDTTKLLQAKIKRIGDEHVLLTKEIQHIRDLIRVGESNLGKATREASDEPRAMTMLMVSDGLYRNRARLAALEKRDSVGLPNERDQLEQALANNRRAQENDKAQIENYRLQLTNLHRTRLVTPPMQSIRPVSLSRPSVVALFVVVGVMLGIVCAFVVEFLNNARKEMAVRYSERA